MKTGYKYVSQNSSIVVLNENANNIIHNKISFLYNTVAFNNNVITFHDLPNYRATPGENKQRQPAVFELCHFRCRWPLPTEI